MARAWYLAAHDSPGYQNDLVMNVNLSDKAFSTQLWPWFDPTTKHRWHTQLQGDAHLKWTVIKPHLLLPPGNRRYNHKPLHSWCSQSYHPHSNPTHRVLRLELRTGCLGWGRDCYGETNHRAGNGLVGMTLVKQRPKWRQISTKSFVTIRLTHFETDFWKSFKLNKTWLLLITCPVICEILTRLGDEVSLGASYQTQQRSSCLYLPTCNGSVV